MNQLERGCGYSGIHFGAPYVDAECFGGQLYDMDKCDNDGNLYEPGDYIPCPECNKEEWEKLQKTCTCCDEVSESLNEERQCGECQRLIEKGE